MNKPKNKDGQFGKLAPDGFTITTIENGIQLSWRKSNISRWVLIALSLTILSVAIGNLLVWSIPVISIILICLFIIIFTNALQKRVLTLTDTIITLEDDLLSFHRNLQNFPVHDIVDVTVERDSLRNEMSNDEINYRQIVTLQIRKQEIELLSTMDQRFAQMIANRIRYSAQIHHEQIQQSPKKALHGATVFQRSAPITKHKELRFIRLQDQLIFSWYPFTQLQNVLNFIVTCIVACIIALFITLMSDLSQWIDYPTLFIIVVGTIFVLITLYRVLHWNRHLHQIIINQYMLTVVHNATDQLKIPVEKINHLLVIRESNDLQYKLIAETDYEDEPIEVTKFAMLIDALFIEQELERFLKIDDTPILPQTANRYEHWQQWIDKSEDTYQDAY